MLEEENFKMLFNVLVENLNKILDFIINGDKRKKKGFVELRVEEFEIRIIYLNMEFVKMV